MSYTFSIKRDDCVSFLEIKVAKEIMFNDPLVYYYVKECYERALHVIMEVIKVNQDKKKERQEENPEQQEESNSDQQEENNSDQQEENNSD